MSAPGVAVLRQGLMPSRWRNGSPRSKHLIFGGLQAYHGSAQHKRTPPERQAMIGGAIDASRRTVEQLRQRGLDCAIVGGAGTGTFAIESASGIYNEIQAGSYVFMDADYARNLDEAGQPVSTFRHALFVIATVMSAAMPGVAVLDAGHKAVSIDFGHADGVATAGYQIRQCIGRARQADLRQ